MRTPVLLFLEVFLLGLSTSAQAQNCQAAFSFGETGLTIAFTDASTSADGDPITSWLWDFEDGATSTLQNPAHTFPSADKYDVCLIVTTQSGCASERCVRIEICVLDVSVNVGECNANNEIPLVVTVNDLFDNAKDISISLDGQLLPGSPFAIAIDQPVTVNTTVPGDGLSHNISVQSAHRYLWGYLFLHRTGLLFRLFSFQYERQYCRRGYTCSADRRQLLFPSEYNH